MTVRRVAFGVYWACLGVLAVLALAWVWIGFYTHSILDLLTWLLLLPTLAVIVVETAVPRCRSTMRSSRPAWSGSATTGWSHASSGCA